MADSDEEPALTLKEMISSVLAAAIGVQSNARRERDFRRGSARPYNGPTDPHSP